MIYNAPSASLWRRPCAAWTRSSWGNPHYYKRYKRGRLSTSNLIRFSNTVISHGFHLTFTLWADDPDFEQPKALCHPSDNTSVVKG